MACTLPSFDPRRWLSGPRVHVQHILPFVQGGAGVGGAARAPEARGAAEEDVPELGVWPLGLPPSVCVSLSVSVRNAADRERRALSPIREDERY